jgi:hypothetical protein
VGVGGGDGTVHFGGLAADISTEPPTTAVVASHSGEPALALDFEQTARTVRSSGGCAGMAVSAPAALDQLGTAGLFG